MKQLQASSALFWEVFRKYDADNRLLSQAEGEVLAQELELGRLQSTLQRMAAQRIEWVELQAPSPFALPLIEEAMQAGWQGEPIGAAHCAPLAGTYFNYRKTTIYGGSNEVQRNIVAQTVLGS